MTRTGYLEAVDRTRLMTILAQYDPHLAGTPPLGLDLPTSDVDVLCCARDYVAFATTLWNAYGNEADFSLRQWTTQGRPVIGSFTAHDWRFEIFGHSKAVRRQPGWRHFVVERRLLALAGAEFQKAVIEKRVSGIKTEPAFALLLGLRGNPYRAVLDLESHSDRQLALLLAAAGFEVQI